MKKIFFFICLVLTASTTAIAQDQSAKVPKTPEERAEIKTQRLTTELGLSPAQQIKTKELLLKREQEKDQQGKNRKAEHAQMKAAFKTFLTAEQYRKLEEKRENEENEKKRK